MRFCLALIAPLAYAAQPMEPPRRLSEEAEMFRRNAPQLIAEETLEQRSLKPPPRFHRRGEAQEPQYQTRVIVSEYTYSSFKQSPEAIHEFRQVISVDGKAIRTPEEARHAMSLELRSDDERARKRMLEDFQRLGLEGAVEDFGQMILLFTKRQIPYYEFRQAGTERIGADETEVTQYRQVGGKDTFLVFQGRKAVREKLSGEIWLRKSDGLPLRLSMRSSWLDHKHTRRHEAVVEYTPTPFGIIVPASVKHSEFLDDHLITENLFRYSTFRRFGADADIKFETAPAEERK